MAQRNRDVPAPAPARPDLAPLAGGDALILVPPFADLDRPCLGVHTLQACAEESGFQVKVLYTNLLLARETGARRYALVSGRKAGDEPLVGERLFARAAHGKPPLGLSGGAADAAFIRALPADLGLDDLLEMEEACVRWSAEIAGRIAALGFPVVGASSSFEQTNAALALLSGIKKHRPGTVTLLGGANCEGPMAKGIAALGCAPDVVFSGESEEHFVAFLQRHAGATAALEASLRGTAGAAILTGDIRRDMEALPTPRYEDYFEQRSRFDVQGQFAQRDSAVLLESSRGCWWGEKHHCTFCGLNGLGMAYRAKSAERVAHEIGSVLARHPGQRVEFNDNIMPHEYFRTLLPLLRQQVPGAEIFYEQKANLGLDRVVDLVRSGIVFIQPGIESLSSRLLRLMDKGVTAFQNVSLLRYARCTGMRLSWNMLYGVPGDSVEDYEAMLALLPLVRHLVPPTGEGRLRIDRFSPYHERPGDYGLGALQPLPSYTDVYPEGADLEALAYYFKGSIPTVLEARPDIGHRLLQELEVWRDAWKVEPHRRPVLWLRPHEGSRYLLLDTRGLSPHKEVRLLDERRATAVLADPGDPELRKWALDRRLAAEVDGRYLPLGTASAALVGRFERQMSEGSRVGVPLPSARPAASPLEKLA